MSSPKAKNQTSEGIAKPGRDPERCSIGRGSRLPSHARSPSTSGQRSKIPTNIGHFGRPVTATPSQVQQENSRLPIAAVASEETACGGDNASPISTARRLTSRSVTAASSPTIAKAKSSNIPSGNSSMMKRQLENQFATKKKRYATLKKELTDKQKNAVDLYEEMSQLREKLITSGGKDPGKIETINLSTVPAQNSFAHFPGDSLAQRGSGEQGYVPNSEITPELVSSLESKLREIPDRCYETCKEALQKRSEFFQWLEKFDPDDSEKKIDPEIAKQLETHQEESSKLETRLEEAKKAEEMLITEAIGKVSALWNEVQVSRARIRELEVASAEMTDELRGKVEAALAEKKSETEKCRQLQERKIALETEMQKLKTKIRGMETKASEDETKIAQLERNVKNLEAQLKQKESNVEQRFKEMQKSLKNSENLLAKTEKQRDSFESRLNELRTSYGTKESEAENRIKELETKVTLLEISPSLVDCCACKEAEISETANGDEKIATILREEKIVTLQREKEEIIEVMQRGLYGEAVNFKFDNDKPHAQIIAALTKTTQSLRTAFDSTKAKNENLQKQLTELQSRVQSLSKENRKSSCPVQANDFLQQQINDLRYAMNELKRRNEELEIQLNQKQLQIEEQDRAMREQTNVLNVRDEVIAILKGNPDLRENSRDGGGAQVAVSKRKNQRDRDQVDKQIAEKTENLQQLFSTLEAKQMQITKLEQIVKQMEKQQDSAGQQRTRLETRIAQLQLALQYRGKSHRYVVATENSASPPTKLLPARESSQDRRSAISPTLLSNDVGLCQPRSFSRPPPPRSPPRQPQMQRSKTLNSFQTKSKAPSPGKEYAFRVMDEVARTLKREREWNCKKRGAREDRKYSREDRGVEYVENDQVLPNSRDISKDEIHEALYNWLVKPWMFEGQSSANLIVPTSDLRQQTHCPRVCSPNSDVAVNVCCAPEDRSPRRQRATNDCSRESRRGSPGCRRQSVPDWNSGSARIARVRTSPLNSPATRSRLQRS